MLLKDLIDQLQALYEEELKDSEVMGEPEIMIDVFKKEEGNNFKYRGFSRDIEIQRSCDGVYPIICAKETWIFD